MPEIAIIIPAWNSERWIQRTLATVQAQTFTDYEAVILDDGSTDSTAAIAQRYITSDPRFRVLSFPNAGLSAARNRGIAATTAPLITWLDADDLWTRDKLEHQRNALLAAPHAGAVYSWTAYIDEQDQLLAAQAPEYSQGDIYPQLLVNNIIQCGSNLMIRRDVLTTTGLFDESLASSEDWEMWLRIAPHCPFAVVPRYQVLYRQVSGSKSACVQTMESNLQAIINKAYAKAPAHLKPLRPRCQAHLLKYFAHAHLARRGNDPARFKDAASRLLNAPRQWPGILFHPDYYKLAARCLMLRVLPPALAARLLHRTRTGLLGNRPGLEEANRALAAAQIISRTPPSSASP